MSKVITYFRQGYNCSESIVKGINDTFNLKIDLAIASPFGSGMGIGSTCGAVTGALIVIGALYGRSNNKETQQATRIANILSKKVLAKYGTLECRTLMKRYVSCEEIMLYTYNLLVGYIQNNHPSR